MKAGHKFLVGAGIIVASVVLLITQGVRETGVYFLTPTELGAAKPAAYATACRWMGTDPSQAVNVGDMLESDVNAAAVAGLTGIWLDRGIDFVTGGPSPTADGTAHRTPHRPPRPPVTRDRLTDLSRPSGAGRSVPRWRSGGLRSG
jgi:hypothetical protein